MPGLKVVLVDDHALVRAGLKALLEKRGHQVVAEADNGNDAVQVATTTDLADVVLMDLSMPGLNGVEATRRIFKVKTRPRVLALSVHTDREYVRQALLAGAAGYLLKSSGPDELELALSAVARGEMWLSPSLASTVLEEVRGGVRGVSKSVELTPRQREVLQLIAEGHSTKQIAKALHLSVKTVESHRAQIMARLDIHHVAGLVRYALRTGIVSSEG